MIALGCIVGVSLSFLLAFAMLCAGSRRDDADEQIARQIAEGGAAIPSFHSTSLNLEGPQDHA